MQRHLRETGLKREEVSSGWAVVYGAAAGYALWATCVVIHSPSLSPQSSIRPLTRLDVVFSSSIYPVDGSSLIFPFNQEVRFPTQGITLTFPTPLLVCAHHPVIKSKLQTDHFPTPTGPKPVYTSTLSAFRQVWAQQGLKGFTNGLGPTLIRSPFANGATFVGFELMMKALSD